MYDSLDKLFYKDPAHYQDIYQERFRSSQTRRLGLPIGDHEAFFMENSDITELMYAILKNDKAIFRLRKELPGLAFRQYSRKCLIDEIVLTNDIEGIHSSRKEINEVLNILESRSAKAGKRDRFLGIVDKYRKLSDEKKITIMTCEDIRNIYDELVLKEIIAENPHNLPDGALFRKEMTEVVTVSGKVLHRGLYPETKIREAMNQALSLLNDRSLNRLYAACLFHYLLEYIHPFYDGNGRLGRFIFSYCLTQELEPILACRISKTIYENINEYYDAFKICNHRNNLGDLTPFLIMMLKMVNRSADDLVAVLSERQAEYQKAREMINDLPECRNETIKRLYGLLLQESLFGENGLTLRQLQELEDISYNTLVTRLMIIQARGLLIERKIGKQNAYSLDLPALIPLESR